MDATQMISDSIFESDEDENEEENENKRGQPLAKLCILKNEYIPETELPLFEGDNVLGRDPNSCTLPLSAPSISKQHATICISVYRRRGTRSEMDIEALVWDLGSMNGTRKGRLKLTPNVRYALNDGDSLVVADIPCHYVSCAVNPVSSQGDLRTPVSRNFGVKARLPEASGGKGGHRGTGSKCVNRESKPSMSLTKTPVSASCLSFEQTPTQPQGTLVPKSDSESEDERQGSGTRGHRDLASDSDSHKSSPTCSTFLSPINKIVPESEDESPVTPLSSTKNRLYNDVSLSKEETEVDAGRQQRKPKQALVIVDNGEEKEERVTPVMIESDKNDNRVAAKPERNVHLTGDDELPVCTPEVSKNSIPEFNMDSDTDMDEEEEGLTSAGHMTLNSNHVNQPPNTEHFHMDSDTDVDEDEDTVHKAPKTVPSSDDRIKPHVILVTQPEGITVDNDTDVDDDSAVSDAATKAKPMSYQSACTTVTAPSTPLKDFCLDSDTDVDEAERECIKNKSTSKIYASHTRLDINSVSPHSTHAAPHSLHLNSDTDEDEAKPTPSLSAASVVFAPTDSCITANTVPDLGILSDSDTDVEADSLLVKPVAVTNRPVSLPIMSEALQSNSDADTDVDESIVPPAGNVNNPADHRVDSGTDVEYKEADIQEAGEGQISKLCSEQMPELLLPLQTCSTPVQYSEREVENMDTQTFLSPSSVPFACVAAPVVAFSSCSDSQEEEDFVVAETQSFVLQTRDCHLADNIMEPIHAFALEPSDDEKNEHSSNGRFTNLGLSNSRHLQCHAQALAMESTQAFVPMDSNLNLQDTQSYAAISTADRVAAEKATSMAATQAYGVDEEPARCSLMSEKEGQVDLALEATQAYISEPCSDSDNETDEKKTTQASDFPTSFTLPMAQTQPMSGFVEEENLATETDKREEHVEVAQRREGFFSEALSIGQTQPMHTCDDEGPEILRNSELCALETQPVDTERESDEDSLPISRKRKAKPLQLEDEQMQPLTNSDLLVAETQPMTTSGDGENDVESEEEKTPALRNTELSAVEAQLVNAVEGGDGDEKHSISGKRRAKPLQLEDTQPLGSPGVSTDETQPMNPCEDEESIKVDSVPGPSKRLESDVAQTQPLTNSDVCAFETQPIVMGEVKDRSNDDSSPGPRKQKAKALQTKRDEPQMLTNYEVSTVGIQPMETKSGVTSEGERHSEPGTSGVAIRNKQGTRENLKEEQQTKCSNSSKRPTRGKNKAMPKNRERGQSRTDEVESEEEEEVVQPKKAKGKMSVSQQKDKEEENHLEMEVNQHVESKSIIKEKQEGRVEKRKDAANLRQQERGKLEKENEICEMKREQEEMQEQQEQLQRKKGTVKQQLSQVETAERLTLEEEEAEKNELEKAERKEWEENEILETKKRELDESLQRERKEQEHQARLEREERERLEKEKEQMEAQQGKKKENVLKVPTRGRRAARRTNAIQLEQDSNISTNDDVPARRTRSHSNSSNSVSSERSVSSINALESRGRGRGRGVKRTSESPQAATTRCSNRRRTVAAETSLQGSNDISPQGRHSRSNSLNSLDSEISNCNAVSQIRGRGGRQRGRGRKALPESIPPASNQNSAPKPATRGRKSRKVEASSNEVFQENKEKADYHYTTTTRGQWQANRDGSEPEAADDQGQSNQERCHSIVVSPMTKTNFRGRGQKAVKSENLETPTGIEGDEAKHKRMGRKRELMQNTVDNLSSSSKLFRGKEKAQTTDLVEGKEKDQPKDESPVQAKRRGRASSAQAKKNAKVSPPEVDLKEESGNVELETVEKRARGQPSAAEEKKKESQEDDNGVSVSSGSQDTNIVTPQPQTPSSSVSRKRQTPVDSLHVAKTPRSSSASPSASGRQRVSSQAYKVLFTGMVDEEGERVLTRLGGSMAKGVADMNCLVTDKVRRTVKFLCAVAKGIPIVTTQWLEKSGKAGTFLSPNAFVVKDPAQEKKFSFSLQESLRTASGRPLLQGYEIHVTKSVKPEPVQMKEIISCCGAAFLPKMPSFHKLQTVVISCEEDWSLCGPAVSASLPVVTAEFILTGVLQQKVDFQTHTLSTPATNPQPAGGRGRARKKT